MIFFDLIISFVLLFLLPFFIFLFIGFIFLSFLFPLFLWFWFALKMLDCLGDFCYGK